jgi:hypothetical protein
MALRGAKQSATPKSRQILVATSYPQHICWKELALSCERYRNRTGVVVSY